MDLRFFLISLPPAPLLNFLLLLFFDSVGSVSGAAGSGKKLTTCAWKAGGGTWSGISMSSFGDSISLNLATLGPDRFVGFPGEPPGAVADSVKDEPFVPGPFPKTVFKYR